MRSTELFELMSDIDDQYIDEVRERAQNAGTKRTNVLRLALIAACAALVIGSAYAVIYYYNYTKVPNVSSSDGTALETDETEIDETRALTLGFNEDGSAKADYTALTGVPFPAENGRLTKQDVYAIYDAAEMICERYDRITLSDGSSFDAPEGVSPDEAGSLRANPEQFSPDRLSEYYSLLTRLDNAVGHVFWDMINAYLPDGAADLLVHDPKINSVITEWAILDLASSGYASKSDAREAFKGADFADYPFEILEFNEYGDIFYYPGDSGKERICNGERRELISIVQQTYENVRLRTENEQRDSIVADVAAPDGD